MILTTKHIKGLFILTTALAASPSLAVLKCGEYFEDTVSGIEALPTLSLREEVPFRIYQSPKAQYTLKMERGMEGPSTSRVVITLIENSTRKIVLQKSDFALTLPVGQEVPVSLYNLLDKHSTPTVQWSPEGRYVRIGEGDHTLTIDSQTGKSLTTQIAGFLDDSTAIAYQSAYGNSGIYNGFKLVDLKTQAVVYDSAAPKDPGLLKQLGSKISSFVNDAPAYVPPTHKHVEAIGNDSHTLYDTTPRYLFSADSILSFNPKGQFLIDNLGVGIMDIHGFDSQGGQRVPVLVGRLDVRQVIDLKENEFVGNLNITPSPKSEKFYALVRIYSRAPKNQFASQSIYEKIRQAVVEIDPLTRTQKVVWSLAQRDQTSPYRIQKGLTESTPWALTTQVRRIHSYVDGNRLQVVGQKDQETYGDKAFLLGSIEMK